MIRRTGWLALAGIVLGFGALAQAEDDLETVEQKIVDAWRQHKSLTAKMTVSSRIAIGETTIEGAGEGTYEFLKHGGKFLTRLELNSTTVQKMDTEEHRLDEHMLAVSDGDVSHTLVAVAGGEARVVKSKVSPQQMGDPRMLLAQLRRDGAVALLPEETLDGRKVYVLEVIPRKTTPYSPAKQRVSFDQESGFVVRIVGLGEDDLPMTSMAYNDIKVDVPINLERFKFTAPEGVEVIDETAPEPVTTQPATAPQTAPAATRPAETPPAPATQPSAGATR